MRFLDKAFDVLEGIDTMGFFTLVGASLSIGLFYAVCMILLGIQKGNNMNINNKLSNICFVASLASVAASILTWVTVGDADPAHAERFGIFIGLWAPTLMGLANYYKD